MAAAFALLCLAARIRVASKVALIGMFRPPVLRGPTLGAVPEDVAAASEDVAFPLTMVMPNFPPTVRAGRQKIERLSCSGRANARQSTPVDLGAET